MTQKNMQAKRSKLCWAAVTVVISFGRPTFASSERYFVPGNISNSPSGMNISNLTIWYNMPGGGTVTAPGLGDAWGFYSGTNANLYLNQNFNDSTSTSFRGPGGLDFSSNTISAVNASASGSTKAVYIVGGFSDPTYGQRTIGVFDAATVSGVKRLSWGVGSSGNIIQTYLTGATTINVNNTSSFQFWLGGIVLEESGTTGSITKVGNGQLILAPFTGDSSSQSSFSGGLTLNEGMVVLGGLSGGGDYKPLGTGTFTINGGTVSVDWEQPAINVTNATNVGADFTFQNSAGTATTFSGNFDFQGGARKITVSSTSGLTGTLTLTGGISNGGIVTAGLAWIRLARIRTSADNCALLTFFAATVVLVRVLGFVAEANALLYAVTSVAKAVASPATSP